MSHPVESTVDLLREKVAICEQRHRRAIDANSGMAGAVSADEADKLYLEVLDARLALARELESRAEPAK
jgi:hypothetical protein